MILTEDKVSSFIVRSAVEVHRTLGGPGLLESVYEEALVWELTQSELIVERQKYVPVRYKDTILETNLCIDVLVENLVIVECKAVSDYNPIFESQALTYLKVTRLKLAMVINFGEKKVADGIHRVVNRL